MPKKRSQPAQRKPRMDAQRNRERILEVAKDAFARSGAGTSLDDIARQAGVGAGTLYRHFPTRDALLEAVYRTEVEKLAAAERKFAQAMPPVDALRAWNRPDDFCTTLFIDDVNCTILPKNFGVSPELHVRVNRKDAFVRVGGMVQEVLDLENP